MDGLTLEGGGTVSLAANGDVADIFGFGSPATLENVDNTIEGYGRVGDGNLTIQNDASGAIDANSCRQALTLASGGALNNHGLVEATIAACHRRSATRRYRGPTSSTGRSRPTARGLSLRGRVQRRTIETADGGAIYLYGTLSLTGQGTITATNGWVYLDGEIHGGTLSGPGIQLHRRDAERRHLPGDARNPVLVVDHHRLGRPDRRRIDRNLPGNRQRRLRLQPQVPRYADLRQRDDQPRGLRPLEPDAVYELRGLSGHGYNYPSETLTLGVNLTIDNAGWYDTIGSDGYGYGAIDNEGTIDVTSGSSHHRPATFVNDGTINLQNWSSLTIDPTTFVNDGTIDVTSGHLYLEDNWSNAANGKIEVDGGYAYLEGNWSTAGTIEVSNGGTVYLEGTMTAATLDSIPNNGGTVDVQGTVTSGPWSPTANFLRRRDVRQRHLPGRSRPDPVGFVLLGRVAQRRERPGRSRISTGAQRAGKAVFVSRVIFEAHLNKLKPGEMVSI